MKRLIGCTAVLCLVALTVGCGGSASSSTLAYVSNSTGNGFTVFTVDSNGTLTTSSISPQAIGQMPKTLQISPNGKWAYFLDSTGLSIFGFERSGGGNFTAPVSPVPALLNSPGSSLAISTNNKFLYAAVPGTGQLVVFLISQDTGALTQVGVTTTAAITQLAIAPDGVSLYGLSFAQREVVRFTLDPNAGAAVPSSTGSVGFNAPNNGMILSPDGNFIYVLDTVATGQVTTTVSVNGTPQSITGQSPDIFELSTSSGVLNNILTFHENADMNPLAQVPPAAAQFPTNPLAGATSNDGRFLFIANQGGQNISVFDIHTLPGTPVEVLGAVTSVNGIPSTTASPFDCSCSPDFIAVSKLNNAIYVLDTTTAKIFQFAVDQNTGRLRALSPASVSLNAGSNPTWITIR